jgi:beta-glucosidase
LVAQLTTEEKLQLCTGSTFWRTVAIPRLGIPSLYLNDGPHGVRATTSNAILVTDNKLSTCFPTPSAMAATWDSSLMESVARAIGGEAVAHGVHVLLAPGVNLQRSPLGGRNFEYFSEDPHVSSVAAAAYVSGIQSAGVAACLKHFIGNDQERDRMRTNIQIDQRALHEVYLEPFASCIETSSPAMIMASYNDLNGEKVVQSRHLLTEVLRERLRFDGVILSDWGAVSSPTDAHLAGLDLEMPPNGDRQTDELRELIANDADAAAQLEARVRRLAKLAMEYGNPTLVDDIAFDGNFALAEKAATDAIVLLSNNGALPITSRVKRIDIVGELATSPRIQGKGSSLVVPERVVLPFDAIIDEFPACRISNSTLDGTRSDDCPEAEGAQPGEPDVTIVFIGIPDELESEGADRSSLDLPSTDLEMLEAVAAREGRRVVVNMSGGPVIIPSPERFDAIVHAGLLGGAVGGALAKVLSGRASPGGRLAQTWPLREADLPTSTRIKTTSDSIWYTDGVNTGYRHYDAAEIDVAYAFGHGLTYSDFEYSGLRISPQRTDSSFSAHVAFDVANTGSVEAKDVPQLYIESPFDLPNVKRLRAHTVVRLQPGDSQRVEFSLNERDFQYFNSSTRTRITSAGDHEIVIGASSRDQRLCATVTVPGLLGDDRLLAERLTANSAGRDFLALPHPRSHFVAVFGHLAGSEIYEILLDIPLNMVARLFPEMIRPDSVDELLDRIRAAEDPGWRSSSGDLAASP